VSLLDVMPTMLDIAAANAPPMLLADPIDGHTLLPMLHMGNKGTRAALLAPPFFGC